MSKFDRLAIDMSSFLWRSLTAGTDKENGITVESNGKRQVVNSAIYGYENIINMMTGLLRELQMTPNQMILVFEGMNSKGKRLLIDSTYKSGGTASHPPEAYLEFQKLRDQMRQVWRDLGAISMVQDYAEGDDTLGFLAKNFPGRLCIATYDGDLTVLNTEDDETNEYGGTCKVWINHVLGLNKFGAFPYKRTRIYKALVGDTSDKIPGVAGFGPAAFDNLVTEAGWDGIDELEAMLDKGSVAELQGLSEENSKLGKLAKKILASEKALLNAWKLVKIYPEWVDTFTAPLQVTAGKVRPWVVGDDERLRQWYAESWLITADNYDDAIETLQAEGPNSPYIPFDIETSTSDESDDWLAQQKNPDGVDTIGSTLTGFSLTLGQNMNLSVYVCVDHADTRNITMVQARKLLELVFSFGKSNVIHNTFFELPVIYMAEDEDGTLWRDHWAANGFHGFIPNAVDTKYEASYVNENMRLGLKLRSLEHLGYSQTSYDETTLLKGVAGTLPAGGTLVKEVQEELDDAPKPYWANTKSEWDGTSWTTIECDPYLYTPESPKVTLQVRRYKMRELSGQHVFGYGVDDTLCTGALHNYCQLIMMLEHTWAVCDEVETGASYLHAKAFVDGMGVSIQKLRELEKIDDVTYDKAWTTVRAYLVSKGWAGTVPPVFTSQITAAEVKHAYAIVTNQLATDTIEDSEDLDAEGDEEVTSAPEEEAKDPVLKTRVRTPAKIALLARAEGHQVFAAKLEACLSSDEGAADFTAWVNTHFKGDPSFKISNKQMTKLLYDVMKCPVQVRGKLTSTMRAKGQSQGNPKGNNLAIMYALRDMADHKDVLEVLQGLRLMQMVRTRRGLYYATYPYFVHWKTGRIHASHNQSATNTRRASESKPNRQQLPKHPKIEGEPARFREVVVPHEEDAVIVSIDFDSQELRIIADYSDDENMVACFVGDNLKSMHSLTGNSIIEKRRLRAWSYEEFEAVLHNSDHPDNKLAKEYRALGKKCNFTTEFGAMAPKLAETMLCSESDAQIMIDAKEDMFPDVVVWKESVVVDEAKVLGYVTTKMGARRHLRDLLTSDDRWEQSKAERQAVNFKVQGSAAEMTKCAEGRMWSRGLPFRFNARYIGPIHDECLWSVKIKDLVKFIPEMHACMVAPYGGMTIPILGSISFGPSFGEQIEIGTEPTEAAILKGLEDMAKKYGSKVPALV